MVQTIIAIAADCDDTLAPDTTGQMLEAFGVDSATFYKNTVAPLVNAGFDPAIAYLNEILKLAAPGGPLAALTLERLREIGAQLKLFPGVPDFLIDLKEEVRSAYGDQGIRLRSYVISGGIADLIEASPIGQAVDEIWGCNFAYDDGGRPVAIKNVVSFTEKTRFLFNIQKGAVGPKHRNSPYAVNKPLEDDKRIVPFKNMIYLGDGPSDIPCMSLVEKQGEGYGCAIGILTKSPNRTWELAFGRRASRTLPPDYTKAFDWTWSQIREAVIQIAERIKGELEAATSGGRYPKY